MTFDMFVHFNNMWILHISSVPQSVTMKEDDSQEWLYELLTEVQLEQFYSKLRDNLQVTRYV